MPEEHISPPEEYSVPPEPEIVDNEFSQGSGRTKESEESKTHKILKKMIFLPAVATISAVSVLFSAIGFDPLGEDLINHPDEYEHHHHEEHYEEESVIDYYSVKYLPTGEKYESEEQFESGYWDICHWVEEQGGVPESIRIVSSKITTETIQSEDYIGVGDEDDPDHMYVPQGYSYKIKKRLFICEASDELPEGDIGDFYFPWLENLYPNGDVNFDGYHILNEDYIIYRDNNKERYVHVNTNKGEIENVKGFSYDVYSNTLTISGVKGGVLEINLMGNGFTVNIKGTNSLDKILVYGYHYGGSVTFTGNGKLTVNKNMDYDTGLELLCESSASCVMIDRTVKQLELYGKEKAICVSDSSLDKSIYYLQPLSLEGGIRTSVTEEDGEYTGYITDTDGTPSKHVIFK